MAQASLAPLINCAFVYWRRWKESVERQGERERESERGDSIPFVLDRASLTSFDLSTPTTTHTQKTLPVPRTTPPPHPYSGHHRHLQRRQGHRGHPPRLRPGSQPRPVGLRRARVLRGRRRRAAAARRPARHPRRQRRRRRGGGRREGGRGGLGQQAGAAAASRDTLRGGVGWGGA